LIATYTERIVRLGFGLLAAALLLTVLLQRPPGGPVDPSMSIRTSRPVAELVGPTLTDTLTTLAINLTFALPLALLLGISAGRRPHSNLDRALMAPAVALMGVPAFAGALLAISSLAIKSRALSLTGAARVALILLLAAWLARAVRNGLADCRTDGGASVPWGRAALMALGRVLQQTGNLLAITMVVEIAGGGAGRGIWGMVLQGAMNRDIPVVYGALWAIIPIVLIGHLAGDLLVTAVAGEGERPGGRISRSWLLIGGLLIAVLLIMPLFGDVKPEAIDLVSRSLPPGPGHLLGTDQLGRDLLARTGDGARVSLTIAGAATLLAVVPAALLSTVGWAVGGWGMAILTPRTAVPNLFGPMLAGLLGVLIFRPSVAGLILFLGLGSIPAMAMACRQFYQPGRTTVPVGRALPALFGVTLLTFAQNLLAESALSFMGLGVQPPLASLGSLASAAASFLAGAPHLLWPLLPGAAGIAGLLLVGYSLADPGRESL
jgi:ABC-type dipeptide/oligopeptide/nickel transport system permease subunit